MNLKHGKVVYRALNEQYIILAIWTYVLDRFSNSSISQEYIDRNKDDNIHKYRSSFAFCSLFDRPTAKIFVNRCSYTRGMCTQKMRALSYIGVEKIFFPPKPDIQTYIQTDGRTLAFIE